jgi:hypothetical protein
VCATYSNAVPPGPPGHNESDRLKTGTRGTRAAPGGGNLIGHLRHDLGTVSSGPGLAPLTSKLVV